MVNYFTLEKVKTNEKSYKKGNLIFSKIVCPRFCGHNVGVVVDYTDMMSG